MKQQHLAPIEYNGNIELLSKPLPYVYCGIRNSDGKIYIGARCGNIRLNINVEDDLGKKYFTSSKYVNFLEYKWEILYIGNNAEDVFDFEGKLIDEYLLSNILVNRKGTKRFNTAGVLHTEKTKLKMSIQRKGKKRKPLSEKHKLAISNSLKGIEFNEERKNNISKGRKGKTLSEQTKQKMGNARRGKPRTEETKKKISQSLKGHKVSEETKLKISQAKSVQNDK